MDHLYIYNKINITLGHGLEKVFIIYKYIYF